MKRIIALTVSFALIFTQLAPMAQAKDTPRRTSKKTQSPKKGGISQSPAKTSAKASKFSPEEKAFLEDMLNHSSDEGRWGNASNVERLLKLIQKDSRIKENYKDSNLYRGQNTAEKVCLRILEKEHSGKFPRICEAHKLLVKYLYPEKVAEEYFEFDEGASNWVQVRPVRKDREDIAENSSKKGTNTVDPQGYSEQKVTDKVEGKQKVPVMDEEAIMLKNADLSYLASSTVEDIPADLKEFIHALNSAAKKGADMDRIMEEAIHKYLDDSYKGANIFPPSYLSLLFKLYMDNVNSLQKAWNYVTFNTPASAVCNDQLTEKCSDIRSFAMEGLLIQPRFRNKLTKNQWAFLDATMKADLSRFEKDSDKYFIELIRQGILKDGQAKVQHDLSIVAYQSLSQGKSRKETIGEALGALALRYIETPGPKLPGPGAFGIITKYGAFQTVEEAVIAAEAAEGASVGTEVGVAGGAIGTASVAIPVALIALFVGGFIYALNDAYGYNRSADAKRQMINYVKRETSVAITKDAPLNPVGDILLSPVNGQTSQPNSNLSLTPGADPNLSPKTRPQGSQDDDKTKETCVYVANGCDRNRYGKRKRWVIEDGSTIGQMLPRAPREIGDEFVRIMRHCPALEEEAYRVPIDKLGSNYGNEECDYLVEDMKEIYRVRDKFKSSKTGECLDVSVMWNGLAFVPSAEVVIKNLTRKDLIRFGWQWIQNSALSVIENKTKVLEFLSTFMGRKNAILPLPGHAPKDGMVKRVRQQNHELTENFEGLLHVNYEEIKFYPVENPYICNHAIYYKKSLLNNIKDDPEWENFK